MAHTIKVCVRALLTHQYLLGKLRDNNVQAGISCVRDSTGGLQQGQRLYNFQIRTSTQRGYRKERDSNQNMCRIGALSSCDNEITLQIDIEKSLEEETEELRMV